jgi:hypothetical protein
VTFAEQASDVFAENANFEKRETAAEINQRSLWRVPDGGGKVQYELLKTGNHNSTVRREFRTGDFVSKKIW